MQAKIDMVTRQIKSYEDNEKALTSRFKSYLSQIEELNEQLRWYE
jgi:hypothetical protein